MKQADKKELSLKVSQAGDNIKPDPKNYRIHSDKNKALINKSLKDLGAGRSIVLDQTGTIVAGNGVHEQCIELGIPVRVIETDGSELIAIQRTDLAPDSKKRRELALADNATSDSSEFDFELLQTEFDTEELVSWGIELDIEPTGEDLIGVNRDNPPSIKITFGNEGDLKKAEKEIKQLVVNFEGSFYSISSGAL